MKRTSRRWVSYHEDAAKYVLAPTHDGVSEAEAHFIKAKAAHRAGQLTDEEYRTIKASMHDKRAASRAWRGDYAPPPGPPEFWHEEISDEGISDVAWAWRFALFSFVASIVIATIIRLLAVM